MSFMILLLVYFSRLVLSSESQYYYDHWCGGELEYLDDGNCDKLFPSSFDKNWKCPIALTETAEIITELRNRGFVMETPLLRDIAVDTTTLPSLINSTANICLTLTKRILKSNDEVYLMNKYYCNGEHSLYDAYETWSSSKIFAMANAGRHLTNETNCDDVYGLINNVVSNKYNNVTLGDLASVVCAYDETAGYTSNSLSSFFHDIGWRSNLNNLINSDWLGMQLNNENPQSLGGNYGEASPSDLQLIIADNGKFCTLDKDEWLNTYDNSISALTEVELLRRIVLHSDIPDEMKFPGLKVDDVKSMLYGASDKTVLFPNQMWGGMSADTSIFLQSSLDMNKIDEISYGNWRIFSKLGAGWSTSRQVGEIISNAYACFPSTANGINDGTEFSITIRGSIKYDTSLKLVEQQVKDAYNEVISLIQSDQL